MGRGLLWRTVQCHCRSFILMFGLPHSQYTAPQGEGSIIKPTLKRNTEMALHTPKHPAQEPKTAFKAPSNLSWAEPILLDQCCFFACCFFQPGFWGKMFTWLFVFLFVFTHISIFALFLFFFFKGYQSKIPWSYSQKVEGGYCCFPWIPTHNSGAHGTIHGDLAKFSNWGQRRGEVRETQRVKKVKSIRGGRG